MPVHPLRDLVRGDAPDVAPRLLGHHLERDEPDGSTTRARIVEVEAYTQDDPACHAHRGRTDANRHLFAAGGTAYVYVSYGIHHCLNVVAGPGGRGQGVLLRAAEVLEGIDAVLVRREDRRPPLRGPGNLASGLAVDRSHAGSDLLDPSSALRLVPGDDVSADRVRSGPRVGVRLAADVPWRFWVDGSAAVSAYRRHPKASHSPRPTS